MHVLIVSVALVVLFLAGATRTTAQPRGHGEPAAADKVGKELRALRITGTPPRIDGQLDDESWQAAPAIDDLVQNEPNNLAAPTERTTIQVAFDNRYIYVAARCFMTDPSQVVAALGRRDALPPSDAIRLGFDPRHDHTTAYIFHTNPAGVQVDDMFFDDTRFSPDYEAVWEVQTAITAEGWTAEFRIPFSQLRYRLTPGQAMVWGFQVRRDIHRKGEFDRWVPTPRGVQGNVSRYGHLIFDDNVPSLRRFEILPYGTVRSEDTPDSVADHGVAGGLDVRMGIGTANTLAATFNPDFGQVEQDPAVLNLSVFESFFPEKRPFFLEDSRIFSLPFPQFPLFHSRRIGQRPGRFALRAGDTVIHRPDQTTILGATKLTGKKGSWTYGVLSALTAAEYATVDATTMTAGNPVIQRTERLIEPRTSYNVARVQRDLFNGTSNVGAVATGVLRDNDVDAFTGGADYNVRWKRNAYRMEGHWVGTRAPIAGVVRDGVGGASRFSYIGKHLSVHGHVDHFSRYFRNADLGFLSGRNNKTATLASISLSQPDPKKYARSVTGFLGVNQQFNSDVVSDRGVIIGMDWQLPTFWFIGWNIGHNFQTLDDLDTRGGPAIVKPASRFLNIFLNSDSRKTWRVGLQAGVNRDAANGSSDRVGAFVNLQPSTQLQLSASTNYNFGATAAQWITNTDLSGDGVNEHVYGTLDRNVLDFTGRVTYSFSRNLTLQMFLQPFVAVGGYSDIRQLARPRSYDFAPASLSYNPNFNTKSLRTNSVLRWEYRPGSTVFVVWNRSSADASRPGVFSPWQDLSTAFGGDGSHVVMIKMNYWLGL